MGITNDLHLLVEVDWFLKKDISQILALETDGSVWNLNTILKYMIRKNNYGIVARFRGKAIGWALYKLDTFCIKINHICVHKRYRNLGIGRKLIERISTQHRRNFNHITIEVPDYRLDLQKFLRASGWVAIEILRGDPDLYKFLFEI